MRLMRLKAPRNLKEPVRCSTSGSTRMRPPQSLFSASDSRSGVSTACPWRRRAASSTSAKVGRVSKLVFALVWALVPGALGWGALVSVTLISLLLVLLPSTEKGSFRSRLEKVTAGGPVVREIPEAHRGYGG